MAEQSDMNEVDRYVIGSILQSGEDVAAVWRQVRIYLPHPCPFATWGCNAIGVVLDIAADKKERIGISELRVILSSMPFFEFKEHLKTVESAIRQEENCKIEVVRAIIGQHRTMQTGSDECDFADSVLAHIGGLAALSELMNGGVANVDPEHLAARVYNEYCRRRYIQHAEASIRKAKEHEFKLDDVRGRFTQAIDMLQPKRIGTIDMGEHMHIAEPSEDGNVDGVTKFTTAIPELDEKAGQMMTGSMLFIAGEPGSGKTGLMWQSAAETALMCGQGSVHCYSFEMTRHQHNYRLQARITGEDLGDVMKGEIKEYSRQRIQQYSEDLRGKLTLSDKSVGLMTVEQIMADIERMKDERPNLTWVYIDRLEKIKWSLPFAKPEQQVNHILAELNGLGGRLGISYVVGAQITKEGRKEIRDKSGVVDRIPEPRKTDIVGPTAVEAEASHIILLWPREVQARKGYGRKMTYKLDKNRDASPSRVHGEFHGPTQKHMSGSTDHDED